MKTNREERFQRLAPALFGALIAASGFVLVLAFVGWFMPRFLHFTESRWSPLFSALALFFVVISGSIQWRRQFRIRKGSAR
jgi:Kef-type K+ transport system membrane component KefB